MFEKIKKETTTEKITQQLRSQIEQGILKPGDKIPSERELCEMLSVSRIAVREAIKALAAKGLLEVRAGEGTYVKSITADDLLDPLTSLLMNEYTLRELLEFRWVMEVQMAEWAAVRAKERDLQYMEEILKRMEKNIQEGKGYAEADIEFHDAIASASGNALLAKMMHYARDIIREVITQTSQVPGAYEKAYQIHYNIFEKIKERDVPGAKEAMSVHLKDVENSLLKAQKMKKGE